MFAERDRLWVWGIVAALAIGVGGGRAAHGAEGDGPHRAIIRADRALDRGEPERAVELYRRLLGERPDDARAYDRLIEAADAADLPVDEARRAELLDEFGEGFELHATPHFLIVYDTERSWALSRAALLEAAHEAYFAAMREAGLRPMPLAERLVCVLFADHADFTDYAARADRALAGWSSGYYSSRTNRIAFFGDDSNPMFEDDRERILALEERLGEINQEVRLAMRQRDRAAARSLRQEQEAARRQLGRLRNRHRQVARRNDASKTTHEALHQLAFNTGLKRPGVRYPFWLNEGMATSFEAQAAGVPFGPRRDNPPRHATLRDAARAGRLIPLRELVAVAEPDDRDTERVGLMYAQSWGLFRFLYHQRREQMRAYLASLASMPRGPRDGDALREEFETAFGPIDELEPRFLRMYAR